MFYVACIFFLFLFYSLLFIFSLHILFENMGVLFDFYIFNFNGLDISFSFIFDYVATGFFGSVTFVGGIVFLYSVFYMKGTIDMNRFFWLVLLFVISMMILIFSGNFFVTMIGWDGLGLVSFCLVIFYSNSSSLESGLVTVFSNRVGDVFFLLSFMFFFLIGFFSWDFCSYTLFKGFTFFLFFGAITKSAQVPFSSWLPAAMAAPTPVSSLVHSSTLVTAGVYVLIRFNYIFCLLPLNIVKIFFVFTMVLAGLCASVESDFKKVVAMSTLSQLGMLMFILSSGVWVLSFFHLVLHSFFKSMLFLSTGSLMYQVGGLQDSRFYGSSVFSYSSYVFFMVSGMCLGGFPFLLGFYSKDFIISNISFYEGFFLYYSFLLGCVFTVLYSFRLIYLSYVYMYSYNSFGMFMEDSKFFLFVILLFFKCSFLMSIAYWTFLPVYVFFFYSTDLLMGVLIILTGLFLFYMFKPFYSLIFFLVNMTGMRWGFSSGTSFLFSKFLYFNFEKTWLESLGGEGLYVLLLKMSFLFSFFEKISLGILTLTFVFLGIYLLI